MARSQSEPGPVRVAETVDDAREWGALLERSFMRFSVEADEPRRFHGSFRVRRAAGIEFIGMTTERHVSHRRADSIHADERPDYLVCLQLEGEGEFAQGARSATVRPGDITFFDTTAPTTVASSDGYRSLCVRIPQDLVEVPRAGMRELAATRFVADDGLTPAIATLLTTFDRVSDRMPARVRSLAAHGALDLISTMFHGALGVREPWSRGLGERELDRMLWYVDRNLFDADLSPAVIAAAHYMSLRRAHAIFHDAGLTISGHILRRRLERCRRDLVDPAKAEQSAAAIGLRWGFRTPSQFGRAFKDAFGEPPAAYRARVLG